MLSSINIINGVICVYAHVITGKAEEVGGIEYIFSNLPAHTLVRLLHSAMMGAHSEVGGEISLTISFTHPHPSCG